jgi:hypothetical protein
MLSIIAPPPPIHVFDVLRVIFGLLPLGLELRILWLHYLRLMQYATTSNLLWRKNTTTRVQITGSGSKYNTRWVLYCFLHDKNTKKRLENVFKRFLFTFYLHSNESIKKILVVGILGFFYSQYWESSKTKFVSSKIKINRVTHLSIRNLIPNTE